MGQKGRGPKRKFWAWTSGDHLGEVQGQASVRPSKLCKNKCLRSDIEYPNERVSMTPVKFWAQGLCAGFSLAGLHQASHP